MRTIRRCLGTAALILLGTTSAFADVSVKSIYDFSAVAKGTTVNADGSDPATPLVEDAAGNLYGTTLWGGSLGGGTVFKLSQAGVLTTLHEFPLVATQPVPQQVTPTSLVIDSNGNLYGATYDGGVAGLGEIFRITGGVFTSLYTFSQPVSLGTNGDGVGPSGLIIGTDGNLYGVTSYGGANGRGTVFQLSPNGQLAVIYNFSAVDIDTKVNADGAVPVSLVQGPAGEFYGTTLSGGASGTGTVFKLTGSGTLTTLHSFSGCASCNSLGTTSPSGWVNADGAFPNGILLAHDGNLYGTTSTGGATGYGTVFRISTTGTFTSLYSFHASAFSADPADTGSPSALVEGADGVFFGTSARYIAGGGAFYSIFSIDTRGNMTILYTFPESNTCYPPTACPPPASGSTQTASPGGGGTPTSMSLLAAQGQAGALFYGFLPANGGANYEGNVYALTVNTSGTPSTPSAPAGHSGGGGLLDLSTLIALAFFTCLRVRTMTFE